MSCGIQAQDLVLVHDKVSEYKIVLPKAASAKEEKAASILQNKIQDITGCKLPVIRESEAIGNTFLYLGHTEKSRSLHPAKFPDEGIFIQTQAKNIVIDGGSGQGVVYAVYSFLEEYAGVHKYFAGKDSWAPIATWKVPTIKIDYKPAFEYREAYYPEANDADYVKFNKLQKLDDLWGIWGHSFDKLVPARTYFNTHPEYYALVKGKRQATQLCLSNDDVYKIVVGQLRERMAANPDAIYWSISPNDDNGYCECDRCKAIDDEQGGPQGSLIKFVNRVAAEFPDRKITTLAYGYTHRAPENMKPAANVFVFLSDIDAFRDKPLAQEGSANSFRIDLKAWASLTPNIFVWDYVTEFTNYLAPFPDLQTLQANMQYFHDNGVKGVFVQGSGDTYGDLAELKCYLIAKLLWDPKANVKKLTTDFLEAYYGKNTAVYIQKYIDLLREKMISTHRKLDIYGNPVNEWNSYLSPAAIDEYSAVLDKAEAVAEANDTYRDRFTKLRLSLEYTVLQQARFFGIEKFGIFQKSAGDTWEVIPKLTGRVKRFVTDCKKAGIKELAEGGLTPDQYQAEWDQIFKNGVENNKALGAKVTLKYPFAPEYPAKQERTLVDGVVGYNDFSYNWLCFYGVPMEATIDLGAPMAIDHVKLRFLDDPRHWIFLPEKASVEVSTDGKDFKQISSHEFAEGEEHYNTTILKHALTWKVGVTGKVRYVRVIASNLKSLPLWRDRDNKKPMIACDEVYVQ